MGADFPATSVSSNSIGRDVMLLRLWIVTLSMGPSAVRYGKVLRSPQFLMQRERSDRDTTNSRFQLNLSQLSSTGPVTCAASGATVASPHASKGSWEAPPMQAE